MNNNRTDLDAMRFHAEAAHEHRKEVLKRIDAALKAEKQPKPRKPKPPYSHKGSWAETANDPIPQHVKDHNAKKNPLYGAVSLGPIDPKYARIFNG